MKSSELKFGDKVSYKTESTQYCETEVTWHNCVVKGVWARVVYDNGSEKFILVSELGRGWKRDGI